MQKRSEASPRFFYAFKLGCLDNVDALEKVKGVDVD